MTPTDATGISASAQALLAAWIARGPHPLRIAISRLGATDAMPLADPFGPEPALEAHAHVDASGLLRSDAYASVGVPVGDSILSSLDTLSERLS